MPSDDDPSHALDDFMRRMRPAAAAPTAAPDLSDLTAWLHPGRGPTPPRPRGGMLRSGLRWDAGDVEDAPVIEVPRPAAPRDDLPEVSLPVVDLAAEQAQAAQSPEIDLPAVPTPPPPDPASLDAVTRQTSERIASLWDAEAKAAARPVWLPDAQALQLRPARDPRLLAQWQPGAWTGAVRQVLDSATEFVNGAGGPVLQTYPPHHLLVLWPPLSAAAPLPSRWPQQVRLAAVAGRDAAAALLELVPGSAPLWLQPDAQPVAADEPVDWALAAEIVLHHEPALRPFQADGLRAFVAAEREASFARLNADYQRPAAGGAVVRR